MSNTNSGNVRPGAAGNGVNATLLPPPPPPRSAQSLPTRLDETFPVIALVEGHGAEVDPGDYIVDPTNHSDKKMPPYEFSTSITNMDIVFLVDTGCLIRRFPVSVMKTTIPQRIFNAGLNRSGATADNLPRDFTFIEPEMLQVRQEETGNPIRQEQVSRLAQDDIIRLRGLPDKKIKNLYLTKERGTISSPAPRWPTGVSMYRHDYQDGTEPLNSVNYINDPSKDVFSKKDGSYYHRYTDAVLTLEEIVTALDKVRRDANMENQHIVVVVAICRAADKEARELQRQQDNARAEALSRELNTLRIKPTQAEEDADELDRKVEGLSTQFSQLFTRLRGKPMGDVDDNSQSSYSRGETPSREGHSASNSEIGASTGRDSEADMSLVTPPPLRRSVSAPGTPMSDITRTPPRDGRPPLGPTRSTNCPTCGQPRRQSSQGTIEADEWSEVTRHSTPSDSSENSNSGSANSPRPTPPSSPSRTPSPPSSRKPSQPSPASRNSMSTGSLGGRKRKLTRRKRRKPKRKSKKLQRKIKKPTRKSKKPRVNRKKSKKR